MDKNLLYQRLGVPPGNFAINQIEVENWGSIVVVHGVYRYPPQEVHFRLTFLECRNIEWFVQRSTAASAQFSEAQLLTHDLGLAEYERTARLATSAAEVIIAYGKLKIERVG
jgi:hypothetical protein